jgi:hypothetical protein
MIDYGEMMIIGEKWKTFGEKLVPVPFHQLRNSREVSRN